MKRATVLLGLFLLSPAAARLSLATCVAGSGPTLFSVDDTFWGAVGTSMSSDGSCVVFGRDLLKFTATASTEIGIRYTWDFGDGTSAATGVIVYHAFQPASDPTVVTLTVSDFSGDQTSSLTLHVACPEGPPPAGLSIEVVSGAVQAPSATGRYSTYFALPGTPVTFLAYGPAPATGVQWRFDHGEPEGATTGNATHTFSGIGWHTVDVSTAPSGPCSGGGEGMLSIYVRGFLPETAKALVILGAGRAGAWSTEVTLANPTSVEQFGTIATVPTPDHIDDCPGACLYFPYHLVSNGTATIHLGPGTGAPGFVGAWYVVPDETGTLPVVAARVVRQGSAVDATLPVYRLSTLLDGFVATSLQYSSPPAPTILPGARRSDSEHSDLLLSVLQPPGTVDLSGVDLHADLFDASGNVVGSREFHLGFGESRVIHDAVSALGVPSLALGQIRVTQTGGTNAFRAVLATTLASGAVTIATGDSPVAPEADPGGHSSNWNEVVAGAGVSGAWDTELALADSSSLADPPAGTGVDVGFTDAAVPRGSSCLQHLSPGGSAAVTASSLSECFSGGPANLYVSGANPRISARIFSRETASLSADLPIPLTFSRSLTQLVFPFDSTAASHRNLFLTEVAQIHPIQLTVEVWSASGSLLSTRSVALASGENRLLGDLFGAFDSSVHGGQIRVTKTGGDGIFWGLLASLGSDGSFTITSGINP